MNQPHDVISYQREYDFIDHPDERMGAVFTFGDKIYMLDHSIARLVSGVGAAVAYHVTLHNGQRVIVRPLSPERLRQREDDRKARNRFIPTVNLDGTTNHETATRIARAFVNREPQRMVVTACDHLGTRGYGE